MRIIKETMRSIKTKKPYTVFLFILFTISFFSLIFSVASKSALGSEYDRYQAIYEDLNYYKLYDNLVGDAEKSFFEKTGKIEKLKKFYNALKDSKDFDYVEVYIQPIEVDQFRGTIEFLNGYEQGYYENQPLKRELQLPDGYSGKFSNVKTIWLSKNAFTQFDIKIENGGFTDAAFQYSKGGRFPVLLGADYSQYYDIGDIFHVGAIVDCGEAEVVGFLEENTTVWSGHKFINLDKYIIMPMLDDKSVIEDNSDFSRQSILYLMKINGIVVTNKYSANEVQVKINEICEQCKIVPYSYIDGATNSQSYLLGLNLNEVTNAIEYISLFLMIYSCVAISIFIYSKVQKKLKYYAILSVCGFSLVHIDIMIVLEIVIFVLLSNIGAVTIFSLLAPLTQLAFTLSIVPYMFFVDILIIIISVTAPIIVLHRNDTAIYFRKK